MKEKLGKFKEYTDKLGKKTKIISAVVAAGVIIFAVAMALMLNNKSYAVLFSDLNSDEAQQIIGKLNEDGVAYQYKGDGTILVDEAIADQLKAELVYEGYPESGFTYDMFSDNAGLMSTDSDKQTYLLYQLQDRIGATIRLFDGVKDAKVTIALGKQNNYVLSSDEDVESSATAVVLMNDGQTADKDLAAAVQRLVAKAVPGMKMENVAVFDGNGNDITANTGDDTSASGQKSEELAQLVETQINSRILNVLEPIYGVGNVRVSSRAQINMERLIRESTTYTVPEKINENDKTGIISSESTTSESSGNTNGAGGVAGTDANSDVPEYNTQENGASNSYTSDTATREYLVNQLKEQGQIDPGVLDDLTVSVVINGKNYGTVTEDKLRELIGNAAGIASEEQDGKISIISTPFYNSGNLEELFPETEVPEVPQNESAIPLEFLLASGGIILFLLLIIILMTVISIKRRRKRKKASAAAARIPASAVPAAETVEELAEGQTDRSVELRKNIRDFTEKNPEISAQLLRSWLNSGHGGEKDG